MCAASSSRPAQPEQKIQEYRYYHNQLHFLVQFDCFAPPSTPSTRERLGLLLTSLGFRNQFGVKLANPAAFSCNLRDQGDRDHACKLLTDCNQLLITAHTKLADPHM